MIPSAAWLRARWMFLIPTAAVLALSVLLVAELSVLTGVAAVALLIGAIQAAVHHAEVIALRVGEPFGALVLAVAVTIIEVGLIVTLMLSNAEGSGSLARDTVFAAVMITCNGIVGVSLLAATGRQQLALFNAEGAGAALATVTTLTTLALVLPSFTGAPGPAYTDAQLVFAAVCSLTLYGAFVITQTRRHRGFFLPVGPDGQLADPADDDALARPTTRTSRLSLGMLVISLLGVVGLAQAVSPAVEAGVAVLGMPPAVVGAIIAIGVLAPESLAAVRAAQRRRVQISLNLAYGSALASIGLTIPVIAVVSIFSDLTLLLGLGPVQLVLFVLTVAVSTLTLVPGRATSLQGLVHLVLLAAFLFLAAFP